METEQTPETTENKERSENLTHKISDEDFISALKVNYGLYAQTARYIEQKYGISYTRQAVQQRAIHFLNEIRQQKDIVMDRAEEALFNAINQQDNLKLQYKAAIFLLTRHNYGKK